MELLLLFSIGSTAKGYELSFGLSPTGSTYAFIVRWNGAYGDFTTLIDPHNSIGSYTNAPTALADGDWMYATVDNSGVLSLYQNNSLIVTATDTTYTSGQPGMGSWPVDGATATSAGWHYWEGGNW